MEKLILFLQICLENWQEIVTGGIILTCSIIFIMGVLKKFLFNRITNKLLRKAVLYFSSIGLAFPATALYFVIDNTSFEYYLITSIFLAVATVLTYSIYENTCLRDFIDFVGEKTVGKWFSVLVNSFLQKKSSKQTKVELLTVTNELKASVREEIAKEIKTSAIVDDDLNDL